MESSGSEPILTRRGAGLPYWAAAAFIARCARRVADLYVDDLAEPESARVAVREAVQLSEIRAGLGGDADSTDAIEFEVQLLFPPPEDIKICEIGR